MTEALVDESGRLVSDLHRALSDLDAARWREGAAAAARDKLADIQARLRTLVDAHWPDGTAALRSKLEDLSGQLALEVPDEDATAASARARWMAFRSSLAPSYDALQSALRAVEVHVPSLRPTNYRRNALHMGAGLLSLTILWAVPSDTWAIAIAVPLALFGWTLEISRRRSRRVNDLCMKMLGAVAHPHEHWRVNSATWLCTALAILALTQEPVSSAVGLAALAFGDPIAALVGRRYGRIRLLHGRTLEGTLAFFVAASGAALLAALAFAPTLGLGGALALALSGAAAGAVAELLSLRIDDNLSVPLLASGGAALAHSLLLV